MALAELMAEVVANPDDDGPRLVWADAIGGERGELVVLQCDLASRTDLSPTERSLRRCRVRELVRQQGRAWSELAGVATKVHFERGFVTEAEVRLEVANEQGDAIVAAAPLLRGVSLSECHADDETRIEDAMAEWFRGPLYARLDACHVDQIALMVRAEDEDYFDDAIPNDAAGERAFTNAIERIAQLRSFAWTGVIPIARLVAARALRNVEWLSFSNALPADAWQAILATTPKLRALDLSQHDLAVELIPATVSALAVGAFDPQRLAARLPDLEELHVYGGTDVVDGLALSRFRRLRTLAFHGTRVSNLARASLPALRELRTHGMSVETVDEIAHAFAAQLERFDVWYGEANRKPRAEIAGELRYEQGAPGPWRFGMGFDWDPPSLVL